MLSILLTSQLAMFNVKVSPVMSIKAGKVVVPYSHTSREVKTDVSAHVRVTVSKVALIAVPG